MNTEVTRFLRPENTATDGSTGFDPDNDSDLDLDEIKSQYYHFEQYLLFSGGRHMPIYEFECLDCAAVFETIVRSAEAARDVKCKKCSSSNIRKNISAGSHRSNKGHSLPSAGAGGCSARSGFS